MASTGLTQKLLKERLEYNPETGEFTRKKYQNKDDPCGTVDQYGYLRISVACKVYKAHRLAWLYVYGEEPSGLIDHINGNRLDNSIANLRCTNMQINALNTTNRRGYYKHQNKYRVRIKVGKKTHEFGCFDTPEEAHLVYINEKSKILEKLNGE
jgi:hypothetical protein